MLVQAEVEKRRQRARKFGTALVEDGLQPALTSQQATKAQQKAEHVAAAAVSGDVEITEAGEHAHIRAMALLPCSLAPVQLYYDIRWLFRQLQLCRPA